MGRKPSSAAKGDGGKKRGGGSKDGRLSADMYDDIEQFHRKKDKINLEASESDAEDDSDGREDSEEGVYELSEAEDSDEASSDGEEEEEKGMIGRLAKQAKLLGQKLKTSAQPDSDDEEDGVEEEGEAKWGKKKRDYYNADTYEYELTDDEDAIQEEENEAVRLQREAAKSLQPGDFGEDDDGGEGDSDVDSDAEEAGVEEVTLERQAREADDNKGRKVERITRDPSTLTDMEKISAVTANAPELLALLQDLQGHLAEIRHRIGPLLEEVRAGGVATKEGVSFLEAKHILLLNYCMCIVFYCLLKAEGKSVKDHPVILRLVQLKTYLDKIRPIEKKLRYQIDKLLSLAATNSVDDLRAGVLMNDAEDEEALLQFKPRLATLAKRNADADDAGREEDAGGALYRPPRINPTAMEGGDPDAASRRRTEARRSKEAVRRAARSETVREMMAEMEGAPEEVRGGGVTGMDSRDALRNKQRMEARDEVEEDMFVRVSLSKEERKRMKSLRRAGLAGNGMLDDFADEVADIVGAGDLTSEGRISQKFGGDMFQANRKKVTPTGDAEVPVREPLSDRRAKMDSKRARESAAAEAGAMAAELRRQDKRARKKEDSTYSAAVEKAQARLTERKSKFAFPELQPPAGETEASNNMRAISREIEKNRGLTPHRSKEKKNPRKKHRLGYAKAQVRRKGQVQEAKTPTGGYGGEETGIKARVTKSRKL